MDNLRHTLEILFCKINPERVIRQWLKGESVDYTAQIPHEEFVDYGEILHRDLNRDELSAIYRIAFSDWNSTPETLLRLGYKRQTNIFNILIKFVRELLCETNELPVCKFQNLLRWRDVSLKLGEDILTTAFFAYKDISSDRDRHFFSWPSVVSTDNSTLKEILSKDVTDLHFHLIGSSLNFDIGWIALMNEIRNKKKCFYRLQNLRSPHVKINIQDSYHWSLYALAVKACAIRQLLFRVLIKELHVENIACEWENLYKQILLCEEECELDMYIIELQDINERLKLSYAREFNNCLADYAIKKSIASKNENSEFNHNIILYGERWMMYKMFRIIFQTTSDFRYSFKALFYAYLLIKIRIRSEFVQVNNYIGFQNFKNYQDRKTLFIQPQSIYERLLVSLAINNSIKSQKVNYLEVRIPPQNTIEKNLYTLKLLDGFIDSELKDRYYYIFHFLKEQDQWNEYYKYFYQPRHTKLRKKIKEQALAINLIRQQYSETKKRVVGIDAAGAEIGCRPEVFAQVYRFLKKYSCELEHHFLQEESLGILGFTYHVGEDFFDIVDGLRAIDEVITFLNFRSGDRLGHCLALGVSPEMFYEQKHYHIIIQKQDLLDNVVWLMMQIQQYDINCSQSLLLELRQKYDELFSEIFCSQDLNTTTNRQTSCSCYIPYNIYYMSWLLRGDNPYLYQNQDTLHPAMNYWDMCGENRFMEKIDNARKNSTACKLYHRYHFDYDVRRLGREYVEYKITQDYIHLIYKIQNAMMHDIANKQLMIECNPTSNKLIGGYNLYSDLPLKRFFNYGLTSDCSELDQCPQLSISINTDDLGVFSTSISNEYALIAIALEKIKNIDGTKKYNTHMIYNWLENIRKMGSACRFKK